MHADQLGTALESLPPSLMAMIEAALAEGHSGELSDSDLEVIVGGKSGGGGGRGGDPVLRGFARLNAFQNFQANTFRNSGVRVGSRREGRYIP